jgi:hypothetical protein
MNNKVKIPVARLKQIIQEEVSRFYGLDDEEEYNDESDEELDEATVTGSTEQDKQAAINSLTNALKSGSADKAVATAAAAGVSVPNVRAVR